MAGLDEDCGEAGVSPGRAWNVACDGGGCDGNGVKVMVRGYGFIG